MPNLLRAWSLLALLLGATACTAKPNPTAKPSPSELPKPVAKPAQSLVAQPFNLHDIQLTPGLFRTGQDVAVEYLLSLNADALLARFRSEAGLEPKAPGYGGWEADGVSGHCGGHYLSACAQAYAATGDESLRERVNYFVSQLAECQQAQGDGYLASFAGGRKVYEAIARGEIKFDGFHLNGLWVPNYTMHKVLAGLRDAYRLCGNTQALEVERKLADWLDKTFAPLTPEQMQTMLNCEHGGLNETLADLYADTGEKRYLALAERIYHREVLEPLARGEDILPGRHANTQIPKLTGLAVLYELTGNPQAHAAAEFFWRRVVEHHSYITGGHCNFEYFGPPDKLSDRLSDNTTETCNVYNMLRLSEHIFSWRPEASVADYYERALLNHIRSSQHPDGRVIYNLTLRPGGTKNYQRKFEDFTCCVGTGMENHVRYGAGIYFHDAEGVWVNLFLPSKLTWREKNVTLTQETSWPNADTSVLSISAPQPQEFTLRIRQPYWATQGVTVTINGEATPAPRSASGYVELRRTWKTDDRVEIHFPMSLRTEAMPDNPHRYGIFYGPTLLAADLGPVDDPAANEPTFVPVLVTGGRPVTEWVQPVDLAQLHFKTHSVGRERDVELKPFHALHDRRYTVFFDEFEETQWADRKAAWEEAKRREAALAARTVDQVRPGEQQSEQDHAMQSERSDNGNHQDRRWRDARDGGFFEYQVAVDPKSANELICTYWGHESNNRKFDILANGKPIATQALGLEPLKDEFFDVTYPLPADLTRDQTTITLRFHSHPNLIAGGLFGLRVVRAAEK